MAINSIEKKEKIEKERQEEEKLRIQSEAIAKLYKNKQQIDNSKNTRH